MSKFIITEPAPSSTSYIRSGRGGAGNTFPISALATSAPSTTAPKKTASSSRRFFSGIGGAGNAHAANERPPVSLDDEFRARAAARDKSSGHCGIGGAGNVYVRKSSNASEMSIEDDDASSRSSMSSKAKLWARVSGTFARD
jgi:hypothetical protein